MIKDLPWIYQFLINLICPIFQHVVVLSLVSVVLPVSASAVMDMILRSLLINIELSSKQSFQHV